MVNVAPTLPGAGPTREVHLLAYDLDADPRDESELDGLLDAAERDRAGRFFFPLLRRRYRVGRAALRCLLGAWTERAPTSFVFATGPQGKPTLAGGPSFNVSHCEGTLIIGITDHGRLGIDVELLRPVEDVDLLARRNFSADEIAAVLAAPETERQRAFLTIWTRKEALIKALGGGLSIPLKSFSVSLAEGPGNALQRLELEGESLAEWCICPVTGSPGMPDAVAALALDAPSCKIEWLPSELAYS